MTATKPFVRALYVAAVTCVLVACASNPGTGPSSQPATPAERAAQAAVRGDYAKATQLYLQASMQVHNPNAGRQYRLEAGLAAAQGGNARRARQILGAIEPTGLKPNDRARYNLARKEIAIANMPPGQALLKLPAPASGTAPAVAQRVWEKRADLYFAENQPIDGIRSLVQRDVWLMNPRAVRANDNRIYDRSLDAIALGLGPQSRPARNAGQTTRGWLALAAIGQSRYNNRQQRDQALAQWQNQYPGHPANRSVLAERFHYNASEATLPIAGNGAGGPRQPGMAPQAANGEAALALPLSGQYQYAAQAIRDGFLFAYQNSSHNNLAKPLVYDSSQMNANQILDRARRDNAGILVGPLAKPKVAAASHLSSNTPEVALNYTDTPVNRPGFYQFALLPEDEARSVATHAQQAGYSRALALVPRGNWGSRVLQAFRQQLRADGGRLVKVATYNPNAHDHGQAIQSVLAGFTASHGANADFIFVAAQPVNARLIRSQIKYYKPEKLPALPMLTTSHAYTGSVDADKDIDLDGVRFVDMPWILAHGATINRLRQSAVLKYGAEARDYARLFAMGMDAWMLTEKIASGGLQSGQTFEGMTGVLGVEPDGRIKRYLGWAVFRGGVPRLLSLPSRAQVSLDSTPPFAGAPWQKKPR